MNGDYVLLNGFRIAKKVFTAGLQVPLNLLRHDLRVPVGSLS